MDRGRKCVINQQAGPSPLRPEVSEAPRRGAGAGGGGLYVSRTRGASSYCLTSEAGRAVIVEEDGQVTGVVTLRRRRGSGLKQVADSMAGTLRRGMARSRRRPVLLWDGILANPPHWSTESLQLPLQYVRWLIPSLESPPGPADAAARNT